MSNGIAPTGETTTPPVPARDGTLLSPEAGQRARRAITAGGALVLLLVFAFSYGNIYRFAVSKGVPSWLAIPLPPAFDVSVLTLMVGLRYLSLSGIPGRRLWPARLFLAAAGLGTWGLNVADSLSRDDWGAAALDSIAPGLLIAWSEVLPWFLRLFREVAVAEARAATPTPATPAGPAAPVPEVVRLNGSRRSRPARPSQAESRTVQAESRTVQMERWIREQIAAGKDRRDLGADADRKFGTHDLGRRVVRQVRQQLAAEREVSSSPDGKNAAGDDGGHGAAAEGAA